MTLGAIERCVIPEPRVFSSGARDLAVQNNRDSREANGG